MRRLLMLCGLCLLFSLSPATANYGDEPLDGRQELFAAIASGSITGDELAELQFEQFRKEMHYIQLQVERFGVDYSLSDEPEDRRYPHSVNQLVVETYSEYRDAMLAYAKPGMYPNPFTAKGADDLNAVCVPFGWNEQAIGNFSYLTNLDDYGNVVSYMVVGYGDKLDSGFDMDGDGQLDGVVISLSSGPMSEKDNKVFYDHGRLIVDGKIAGKADATQAHGLDPEQDSPELQKAKEAKIKHGAHLVQLSLERYRVDTEHYPQCIDMLVFPAWSEYHKKPVPYLPDGLFYTNPLAVGDDYETSARCVPFGWTPEAPGNFSYLTQYDEAGAVSAYALVGYGSVKEDGMDIDSDGVGDGIVIILWSGHEYGVEPLESGVYEYFNCGRIVELPFTRPGRRH